VHLLRAADQPGARHAKLEDRQIRDGEVLTACQSACPTDAIVFGNINDPQRGVDS
jgi:molybdopterin-containing oxidoreductase family iron-sulfur binding subunit